MIVKVVKSGKKTRNYGEFNLSDSATLQDLKIAFQKQTKISIHRQGFKFQDPKQDKIITLAEDEKTLSSYGIKNGNELQFKDFGPQIGYRTVFVLEYLGPLLIVLFYAMRPEFLYGKNAAKKPFHPTAWLGVVCWSIHFFKREFETFFIHRFSRPTMPLFNLFKNCAYYWSFGAVIGYPLCSPKYTSPSNATQIQIGLAIFAISEFLNFCVHVQLRNLRPAEGSKVRPIPKGPLFALVSCPNYTFEVLGWIGFSILTQIFFCTSVFVSFML